MKAAVDADVEFAASLWAALGPLYRVSVRTPDGAIEAAFGEFGGEGGSRMEIPLPRSTCSLVVEMDMASVQAADRMVHALARAPGQAPIEIPHLEHALDGLIAAAEAHIGRPIADMSRAEKQGLVKFLDERGAFSLRKSVEAVADILGVSRFTVYNYLDASRQGA